MIKEPKITTGREPNIYTSPKQLIGFLMILPALVIEGEIIILLAGNIPLKKQEIIFRASILFTICISVLIYGIIRYRKLRKKEKRWSLKLRLWRILHPQLRKNWTR